MKSNILGGPLINSVHETSSDAATSGFIGYLMDRMTPNLESSSSKNFSAHLPN